MIETILGGLLAILGGWGSTYFQLRYAGKNKMEEVLTERKIEVNAQAYSIIKDIQGSFIQASLQDTNRRIFTHQQWFFDNRLFLPGKFPSLWLSIRSNVSKIARREQAPNQDSTELEAIDKNILNDLKKAITEIYNDMGIDQSVDF